MMKRFAFTMIELVFVIVILGILAAVAVPKLAATRDDAQIAKGRSDVAAIRAAIVSERQSRLLQGETNYIATLSNAALFDGDGTNALLQYGMESSNENGHWSGQDPNYSYHLSGGKVDFVYNSNDGTFDCNHADANCLSLVQ